MELPEGFKKECSEAKSVVFFTGAGVSAESGIPTFRGEDGLWRKFRAEEIASLDALYNNTKEFFEFYRERFLSLRDKLPNPGHYAISEMESVFPDVSVITQNIDGLHRKAGSKQVFEIHGSIFYEYCQSCRYYQPVPDERDEEVPRCPKCGGLLRPDVVLFGEAMHEPDWSKAYTAASSADIFFSVGTSALVYPAASLPFVALERGAYIVEVNPADTPFSRYANFVLHGKSGEILPELVRAIKEIKG